MGPRTSARTDWRLPLVVGLALAITPARAFINPKSTPEKLVSESALILTGCLQGTGHDLRWTLKDVEVLKGEHAGKVTIDLTNFKRDQIAQARRLLLQDRDAPVLLFVGGSEKGRGLFHIAGIWIEAKSTDQASWDLESLNMRMSGTYAGGTKMLVRMTRYLLANPDAKVPTSVATCFMPERYEVGRVKGNISGMEAIELKRDGAMYLYVASAEGDRLYRPKDDDEGFVEVTEESKLSARSRQSLWTDLNADGH